MVKMKTIAIILAGGSGERFGGLKQFVFIHDKPILAYTMEKFKGFKKIITVPASHMIKSLRIAVEYDFKDFDIIEGGNTRQESVKNALRFAKDMYDEPPDNVVITEATRPLITKETIRKGISLLQSWEGVVSVCKAINTVCTLRGEYKVLSRNNMYELLMPQFFRFNEIYDAHIKAERFDVTDDSQLLDGGGVGILEIPFWEGLKLTYPNDYKVFEFLLKEEKNNE